MDENKSINSTEKNRIAHAGAETHGVGGNGIGGTTMTPRNPGGSIPIFIDIENLDLTFICGDQENYHENINDGFGSMGGVTRR